nr:tRNA (guanine-N(1)-)-methyltransferase [uncultured archaeon]
MKFDIVTLFPNFFNSPLQESLLSKAIKSGLLEVEVINLRNYSPYPHRQVDDTPYGGGAGMILKPDVLSLAVKDLKTLESKVILTDPSGQNFNQELAQKLAKEKHLIIVCGRYEGVDQRFKDRYVDLEISIGDYILNGGEAASLVILETISRLVPGVIGSSASIAEESFSLQPLVGGKKAKLLEYPQYTRPEVFEGEKVPEILLSGDHGKIKTWRQQRSLEKTKRLRPDLLKDQ